ncbi:hypothetical protein CRYUN_Cryun41cG0032600 [Craigia yunnanensis]
MGKLGKKARKFAKKNLQSVFKRKRKLKSMFKKKASKRDEQDGAETLEEDQMVKSNGRDLEGENIEDAVLDAVFSDESNVVEDDSGSDGYLSEDSGCAYLDENGSESNQDDMDVDNNCASDLSVQNREILIELTQKRKKLERLLKKDFEFSKFLESYENGLEKLRDEENYSDEDNTSDDGSQNPRKDTVNLTKDKLLTSSALNSLCQQVRGHCSISALTSLLNGYRATCHAIMELNHLVFSMSEADNIFRGMLGISCSSCKRETILELKNTSKWNTMKPLIKSYLRSTLFLLNQVTDSEILALSLVRLRASIIFFAAFRPLLHRLIKEAVKRISSWQYTNCIDLWVSFISANVQDYDLQPLLYMIIQIINGVAVLFPAPRYLPLRLECIQWLNNLSTASGVFIPVASFTLDILEYKTGKDNGKPGRNFNFSSNVKEQCVSSVVEILAMHFAQWSYHITFPELATIPLIRLRKFHEMTTIENFRRVVKRFIDQRKRDEVAFSPKDHQSVESFLQFDKSSANASFTQYYKSIMEKAASRNLVVNQKIRANLVLILQFLVAKEVKKKKKQRRNNTVHLGANDIVSVGKKVDLSIDNGRNDGKMRKKRRKPMNSSFLFILYINYLMHS